MKNARSIFVLLFFLIFTSCKTPNILIADNLQKSATPLEVKGRNGLRIHQVLTYGGFKTGRVK